MDMDQEESIQLVDHTPEEYDNLQVMSKYWRSKSLPLVYVPPAERESAAYVDKQKAPLAGIRENSEESEEGRGGGTRTSSIRSDNTNNTLLINEKIGSERLREGRNSLGQDARDSKKRSEWRTLQQHYYPEGDWGWVVTVCAVACHAITTGIQLYISNVVYARFNEERISGMLINDDSTDDSVLLVLSYWEFCC
ncbi:unnamed protein product [Orchesella dallaii]|uniref:Uncharacterized protein n=1 Tax=Orchesella dallaii TaxID=48710 RepID=A0ABP1QPW1_9HEXA